MFGSSMASIRSILSYKLETSLTDQPVLLFLHGAGLNRAMWQPVIRRLDPRWRTVAIDLPGHGALGDAGPYTLEAAAKTVAEAARALAPARVILVGDSLGGYSALAASKLLDPAQVVGYFLGGCSQNFQGKHRRSLRLRAALMRLLIPLFGEERLARKSAEKLVGQLPEISKQDIDAMVSARMRLRAFPEAVAALATADVLPLVRAISQPLVFVNGTKDEGPMEQEAAFVAAARQGSSVHFDCEHGVSLLKSAEFASALEAFALKVSAS